MKVRELIAELIRYDMDDDVLIGLGEAAIPCGKSDVHSVRDYSSSLPANNDGSCSFGVYIIPTAALFDNDA